MLPKHWDNSCPVEILALSSLGNIVYALQSAEFAVTEYIAEDSPGYVALELFSPKQYKH